MARMLRHASQNDSVLWTESEAEPRFRPPEPRRSQGALRNTADAWRRRFPSDDGGASLRRKAPTTGVLRRFPRAPPVRWWNKPVHGVPSPPKRGEKTIALAGFLWYTLDPEGRKEHLMAKKSVKPEETAESAESTVPVVAPTGRMEPVFPEPPPRVERSRYVPDGNMTVYDELVGDPSNPYSTMW